MALRIKISARAESHLRKAAEWWAQNRPAAPGVIDADFGEAVNLLAEQPGIGAKYEDAQAPGIRRLFLGRVGYFIYYKAENAALHVLALWHASREHQSFDVFLSHNSKDKAAVRALAEALCDRGLKVWLDEWELIPGRPWQEALEEVIETTVSSVVLVGKDGLGPWQDKEMRACLSEFVDRGLPVIPALLPGAPEKPRLPIFLKGFTWVDLRGGMTEEGIDRLYWGITDKRPPDRSKPPTTPIATPEAVAAINTLAEAQPTSAEMKPAPPEIEPPTVARTLWGVPSRIGLLVLLGIVIFLFGHYFRRFVESRAQQTSAPAAAEPRPDVAGDTVGAGDIGDRPVKDEAMGPPVPVSRAARPHLLSPPNGEILTGFPRTLKLTWAEVVRARSYHLQLQIQDPGDLTWQPHPFTLGDRVTGVPSFSLEFVGSQRGRWRVAAISEEGEEGEFSAWSYFTFADAPLTGDQPDKVPSVNQPGKVSPAMLDWVQIPAGTFSMGSAVFENPLRELPASPLHQVRLDSFYMTKTEITVAQYKNCVEAGRCSAPRLGSECTYDKDGAERFPVNCVTWFQAQEFAVFIGQNVSLPTEAEWEYAARSAGKDTLYTWLSGSSPSCELAVMGDCHVRKPREVCSRPAGNTEQGLCDMLGNVWELTLDWAAPYSTDTGAGTQDNPGLNPEARDPESGARKVIRGGTYSTSPDDLATVLRSSDPPDNFSSYAGFRLVRRFNGPK